MRELTDGGTHSHVEYVRLDDFYDSPEDYLESEDAAVALAAAYLARDREFDKDIRRAVMRASQLPPPLTCLALDRAAMAATVSEEAVEHAGAALHAPCFVHLTVRPRA